MKQNFKISAEDAGKRLDFFLLEKNSSSSRSQIKNAIDGGFVLLNGKVVKAGEKLKINDEIEFDSHEKKPLSARPQEIDIDVVFEDENLAVINKARGMVVHPANGNEDGTLVNALAFRFKNLSGVNGEIRPGIVHRLDKDTSGLMLVAKTDEAHRSLAEQIEKKICVRKYYALLEGRVKEDEGTIDKNLIRSDRDRKKYTTCEKNKGRRAVSHFKVVQRFENNTLCEFKLETGRTHQIRVHSASIGHPVVGDPLYGFKAQKWKTDGQLLHSHYIGFYHPKTGEFLEFENGIPDYMASIIAKLKKCD